MPSIRTESIRQAELWQGPEQLDGVTRDEHRYTLDLAYVMGEDYISETFCVHKVRIWNIPHSAPAAGSLEQTGKR